MSRSNSESVVTESAPSLLVGAATTDITPESSVFLYGYPHVPRMSTGVHDRLECGALYLGSPLGQCLFLAVEVIYVPQGIVTEIRGRISAATGVPDEAILVGASHTHSGPVMAKVVSNGADPVVPPPDSGYLQFFADRVVAAGISAVRGAVMAEVGLVSATAEGVGTNRHDPKGPTDREVPVLVARSVPRGETLACLVIYGMHTTVLHEDSTLISGDFPHFMRALLRRSVLPADCPVLFFQGASGNQSPRHVTQANTFGEARRIGEILGSAVAQAIGGIAWRRDVSIWTKGNRIALEPRQFPSERDADAAVLAARGRWERLLAEGAPRQAVRSSECDVFGAEETAELARAVFDGRLAGAIAACSPAEVQVLGIGPWKFVAWPGEFFVEYALELKRRSGDTYLITLANGELQGYVVTPEAAERGVYESTNAVFSAENGPRFIEATMQLLAGER